MAQRPPLHHFTLTPALIAASSWGEARDILWDMEQFKLCRLPYPECDISMRVAPMVNDPGWFTQDAPDIPDDVTVHATLMDVFQWHVDPITKRPFPAVGSLSIIALTNDNGRTVGIDLDNPPPDPELQAFNESMRSVVAQAGMLLISSLAATNTVQQSAFNKRAARGVGHGKFKHPWTGTVYISTTQLAPPSLPSSGGASPRPHIRRGHIHTFLTGPGRSEPIKKFVSPCFVNGAPPNRARNYVVR